MPIVLPILAFNDNYIWAIVHKGKAIVVDPGDAKPVQHFLQQHQLRLAGILITHWHADHTGGIASLLQNYPDIAIIGPKHEAIPANRLIEEEQEITLAGINFQTLEVPGHTLEHIAFYQKENGWLFCGDTLFAAGCGRIFEGTPEMMLSSLNKLAALPDDTQIYCAHEYTVSNLHFAQAVEPNNSAIQKRLQQCIALREKQHPTLPSTLAIERKTNPFLRADKKDVAQTALNEGAKSDNVLDVFTLLREWKNNF